MFVGGGKLSPWPEPKASPAHPHLQRGPRDTGYPQSRIPGASAPLATHPAMETIFTDNLNNNYRAANATKSILTLFFFSIRNPHSTIPNFFHVPLDRSSNREYFSFAFNNDISRGGVPTSVGSSSLSKCELPDLIVHHLSA